MVVGASCVWMSIMRETSCLVALPVVVVVLGCVMCFCAPDVLFCKRVWCARVVIARCACFSCLCVLRVCVLSVRVCAYVCVLIIVLLCCCGECLCY